MSKVGVFQLVVAKLLAEPNPALQQTAPAYRFLVTIARTGGGRC